MTFVYKPENCTEVIPVDLPDTVIVQLALMAQAQDITINHLLNKLLYEELKRLNADLDTNESSEE